MATKEELDKEIKDWLDVRYLPGMGIRQPCKLAYLACAEPREKRISKLEAFIKTQDRKLQQIVKECDKAIDRVESLTNENKALKAKMQWHKVSEQIPTEEKKYLIKFKDGTVDVMWIALDGNLEPYVLNISVDFYRDVEKWCEIPEDKELDK